MQEPHYRSPACVKLLDAVGKSRVPCMSIMNMPPLPYIKRIPGLDNKALEAAYTDPRCGTGRPEQDHAQQPGPAGDPPARRPGQRAARHAAHQLQCARFEDDKDTQIVRNLEKDVDAARFDAPEGKIELPVKLKRLRSIFVPLAKWSMLLAGNYRCITKDGMRTAQEAVHTDIEESRSVYNFVFDLCVKLGAKPDDLVPFENMRRGAEPDAASLGGARAQQRPPNIERADKLVQLIAKQKGLSHPVIDAGVALVDERLAANRKKARSRARHSP